MIFIQTNSVVRPCKFQLASMQTPSCFHAKSITFVNGNGKRLKKNTKKWHRRTHTQTDIAAYRLNQPSAVGRFSENM